MSLAITADEPRLSLPRRFIELLPGLALLFAIGFSGKLIEQAINGYGKAHQLVCQFARYRTSRVIGAHHPSRAHRLTQFHTCTLPRNPRACRGNCCTEKKGPANAPRAKGPSSKTSGDMDSQLSR